MVRRPAFVCCLLLCLGWLGWLDTLHAQVLWYSNASSTEQIELPSRRVIRSIPLASTATAALPDGGAWLLDSDGRLRRIRPDGSIAFAVAASALFPSQTRGKVATRLAADPDDQSVWIAYLSAACTPPGASVPISSGAVPIGGAEQGTCPTHLARVSGTGQVSARTTLWATGWVLDFAIDQTRRVWALAQDALEVIGPDGLSLKRAALVQGALAGWLVLDPFVGVAYYAAVPPLSQSPDASAAGSSQSGRAQKQSAAVLAVAPTEDAPMPSLVRLDPFGPPWAAQVPLALAAYPLALDPRTGDLWVSSSGQLMRVAPSDLSIKATVAAEGPDPTGPKPAWVDPVTGMLLALQAQADGRMLLAAYDEQAVPQVAQGAAIAGAGTLSGLPLRLSPQLNFTSPAADGALTGAGPTLTFEIASRCNGQDCTVAPQRMPAVTLTADVDGIATAPTSVGAGNAGAVARWQLAAPATLSDGAHVATIKARDASGLQVASASRRFVVDTLAPAVGSITPVSGTRFAQAAITVSGTINEPATVRIGTRAVNDSPFSIPVTLGRGANTLALRAVDLAGNITTVPLTYHLLAIEPSAPLDGATVDGATLQVTGTFAAPDDARITVNQVTAALNGGTFAATLSLPTGPSTITLRLESGGVSVTRPIQVTRAPDGPPPTWSPPAVDETVASDLATDTEFLYTGAAPPQKNVRVGTINRARVAVIRGRVLGRNGLPLAGVSVSVLNQPDYGSTTTRSDGGYDFAVNGADRVVLAFSRAGHLPVQRAHVPRWNRWLTADDVTMVPLDPLVTTIVLGAGTPPQLARGSVSTDADGSRRASIHFPAGTTAMLVLPDGRTQSLGSMSVRATEYTVGTSGAAAMPGDLPPASAYTYAVELSIDEAIAAQATEVRFSRPVPFYVDNFLRFPVGMTVPVGWYDRQQGRWVPSDNGRVMKLLAVNGGRAQVDTDGDGVADNIGIDDDDEARALATLFGVGDSFWRTPVEHFSAWDCNWPGGPPPGAGAGGGPAPPPGGCDGPGKAGNSTVHCGRQALEERIPLAGVPFELVYDSARSGPASRTLDLPISGDTVPQGLLRIDVVTTVAGRALRQSYGPLPKQSHRVAWDGLDAYGRTLNGGQPALVRIGYVYKAAYYAPADQAKAFGAVGSTPISGSPGRGEITLWREFDAVLGSVSAASAAVGSWAPAVLASYDPVRGSVLTAAGQTQSERSGAGRTLLARRLASVGSSATSLSIDRAGNIYYKDDSAGVVLRVDENGTVSGVASAGQAISAVHVSADGTLYMGSRPTATVPYHHLLRQRPGEALVVMAGAPSGSVDDGAALETQLMGPITSISTGSDGAVYFIERVFDLRTETAACDSTAASFVRDRLREVTSAGRLITRMGAPCTTSGAWVDWRRDMGFAPLPAARAVSLQGQLRWPDWGPMGSVVAAPDGTLFVSHKLNGSSQMVSALRPDGTVVRHAGGIRWLYDQRGGDGMPKDDAASRVNLHDDQLALSTDGELLVAEGGGGQYTDFPNGFAEGFNLPLSARVRSIDAQTIRTLAGGGDQTSDGDARSLQLGPRPFAGMPMPYECNLEGGDTGVGTHCPRWLYIAAHPRGGFAVLDSRQGALIRVGPPHVLAPSVSETRVPSASGDEILVFDARGRHLRTQSAQSGATNWSFGYDAQGALQTVTDGSGNTTRIERDAQGRATSLVAPFGQLHALSLDSAGRLTQVTHPLGFTHDITYNAEGLLASFRVPGGRLSSFTYDNAGRLARDANSAGGFWQLSRDALPASATPTPDAVQRLAGHVVRAATAEGRRESYQTEYLGDGSVRHTTTAADGAASVVTLGVDGSTLSRRADGSMVLSSRRPHPRLGLFSPLLSSTTTLPSGLTLRTQEDATVAATSLGSFGDETRTVRTNGRATVQRYSAADRQTTLTSPAGRNTVLRKDATGRVVFQQTGPLAPMAFEYDAQGRLLLQTQGTGVEARSTRYAYGSDGLLASVTDALGRTSRLQRDAAGRVLQALAPDGSVMSFTHDANDNLLSLAPPGRPAHTFSYNSLDLHTHYTPPLLPGVATPQQSLAYNLDKDLTSLALADGRSLSLGYGAATGQLRTLSPSSGGGQVVTLEYAPSGQLARASTPEVSLALSYDGPLPLLEQSSGTVQATLERRYDADAQLSDLLVGGQSLPQAYDADGLLTQAGPLQLTRDAASGQPLSGLLGQTRTSWGYNSFGELTSLQVLWGGTPLYQLSLGYDALGRVVSKSEALSGSTLQRRYGYDAAGRLAQISSDSAQLATIGFDANGNRTQLNGQTVASFDAQDRLVQQLGSGYAFNDVGQLTARTHSAGSTQFRYDVFGLLQGVTLADGRVIAYVHDAGGRRVARKVNGSITHRWVWQDSLRIAAEVDSAGAVITRFVYGDRVNVPDAMLRNGRTWRLVTDHLGSVRLVVDADSGQVAQRIDYDEWGQVLQDTNPGFQPFGFAGGLYDPDTTLVRFGARDYDAATGRWTAKDPIGFGGGDANLYAYAGGNPISNIDFTGSALLTAVEGQRLVNQARQWNGVPYFKDGGASSSRDKADCSGATWRIYQESGYPYAYSGSNDFPSNPRFKPSPNNTPQAGDVGWWRGHVLIYDPGAGSIPGAPEGADALSARRPGVPFGPALTSWWAKDKGPVKWFRYDKPDDCNCQK